MPKRLQGGLRVGLIAVVAFAAGWGLFLSSTQAKNPAFRRLGLDQLAALGLVEHYEVTYRPCRNFLQETFGREDRVQCDPDNKECLKRDLAVYSRLPEVIGESHVFSARDDADAISFATTRRPDYCGAGYLLRGDRKRDRKQFEQDYVHNYKAENSAGPNGTFWYDIDQYRGLVSPPRPQ